MSNAIFSEDNLKVFVLSAHFSSFSDAAQEMGMTTSGVSYAIKRLESLLGAQLFKRTTRHVLLTEAGRYFYARAQALLDEYQRVERGITSISQGVESNLRICINNLLHTPRHTTTLVALLKERFPDCQLRVHTEVYGGVWDALLHHNADFAIGAPGTLTGSGAVSYEPMAYVHWKFVVAPDHPLVQHPMPLDDALLRQFPAICVDDTSSHLIKRVAWLLPGQEPIFVPDMDSKQRAQELGLGIGFLPDFAVKEALASRRLVELQVQTPRQPSLMLAAWKNNLEGSVIQWLKSAFQPGNLLAELYKDLSHP